MKVILATVGNARSVIVEGPASAQTVYYQDKDECAGWNPGFEADLVARALSEAFGVKVVSVDLCLKKLPEGWGLEYLQKLALEAAK